MAGKQCSVAPASPVHSKYYQFDLPNAINSTDKCFDKSRFYLPVTLPSLPSLPADVALWLIELRHKSDSSDLAPPRQSVGEEAVWYSDEDEEVEHPSLPDSGAQQDSLCEVVCRNVHECEDTVLNLDLHRKKNSHVHQDYDNDDLYQIWEGLKIPRQSLCASSLRVPNLNSGSEVLSRNSETDSRSYIENPRSHSFWEVNPMYSKGGLKDTRDQGDIATTGENKVMKQDWRREDVGWYPRGFIEEEVNSKNHSEETASCGARCYKGNDSAEEILNRPARSEHNLNWRLTDITEESVDEAGYILNHENNYGLDVMSTCDGQRMSPVDLNKNSTEGGQCQLESTEQDANQPNKRNSALELKCVNILNNLDDMIQTFEQIQEKVFSNDDNNKHSDICIKDNEFDHMCERAEHIIEETLKCQQDSSKSPVKVLKKPQLDNVLNHGKQERTSSDMSDEVFLNPVAEKDNSFSPVFSTDGLQHIERINTVNVNEIFDDGSKITPPVPPIRRKKVHDKNLLHLINTNSNTEKTAPAMETKQTGCKDSVILKVKCLNGNAGLQLKDGENAHSKCKDKMFENIVPKDHAKRTEGNETSTGESYKRNRKDTENINITNDQMRLKKDSNKHRTKLTVSIDDAAPSSVTSIANDNSKSGPSIHTNVTDTQTSTNSDKYKSTHIKSTDLVNTTLPDECFSSLDSNDNLSFDPKIQLTQTRPISFSTFPPSNPLHDKPPATLPKKNVSLFKDQIVNQQKPSTAVSSDIFTRPNTSSSFSGRPISFHTFSKTLPSVNTSIIPDSNPSTTLLKYSNIGEDYNNSNSSLSTSKTSSPCDTPKSSRPKSARASFDTTSLDESLERTRKGSNASDIAAWKLRLQMTSSYYHDEEMDPNHMMSNEWFSSNATDSSILIEENSRDASWVLPDINITPCALSTRTEAASAPKPARLKSPDEDSRIEKLSVANIASLIEAELRGTHHGPYRVKKAKSLLLVYTKGGTEEKGERTTNWADQWDASMRVLKEGILCRTKITEHGKKVRKNWVTSYAVLTESCVMFFKDAKTFQSTKINADKFNPELSVDLCGAMIEQDEKLSSRKNVMVLSDAQGLQVLLQLSSSSIAEQWFHLINTAIALLTSTDRCLRLPSRECSPTHLETTSADENLIKSPKMSRSRSIKLANKDLESNEDLSASAEERQTKNKARLKKFFGRRPTKESLVKKGIYKDEPVFGRNLCDVVSDCVPCVPSFVTKCIHVIESKDENMKTDGLYRASGNLSQVQKIRLQVDQNQLYALEQEDDVHVLTGALKLFFRELKKPLIPFELFNKAITASAIRDHKQRVQQFRQLVQALPTPNHNTLDCLLQHLLKVNENKEFNRMHIPNIAIVFGPTLMWPEEESLNMALDLMKQNLVIECLLVEYYEIFR